MAEMTGEQRYMNMPDNAESIQRTPSVDILTYMLGSWVLSVIERQISWKMILPLYEVLARAEVASREGKQTRISGTK